jgi:hypothetical protein
MKETEVSRLGQQCLRAVGLRAIRVHAGKVAVKGGYMQLAPAGWPDFVVPLPLGRVLWWESKTPTGKLSEDQKRVHASLRRMGHSVITTSDAAHLVECAIAIQRA